MAQRNTKREPAAEIPGLPRAARRSFPELMADTSEPSSWIRGEVQRHLGEVRAAALTREFVDLALAERVAGGLCALLDGLDHDTPDTARNAVYAAARYFALHDDGNPDLDSVVGFHDDAEVLNAVARYLGRQDLVIELE